MWRTACLCAGYRDMLAEARRFPQRVWAIEGCNGIGKHIAHRLVHDGETVFEVPPKPSAQVRVFAAGNGRKTDPVDAHSVAMAALHTPNLVRVEVDDRTRGLAESSALPCSISYSLPYRSSATIGRSAR